MKYEIKAEHLDKIIAKQKEINSLKNELIALYEYRTPPELGSVLRTIIKKRESELAALEMDLIVINK